jgi:hypothetical protein
MKIRYSYRDLFPKLWKYGLPYIIGLQMDVRNHILAEESVTQKVFP